MREMTRRPSWLNKKVRLGDCAKMDRLLTELRLHTVCEEAACPNRSECFAKGTATFMILGNACTRNCLFCNLMRARPSPIDWDEPERISRAVHRLGLKHVVITSVTRDDLEDGGASVFAETIEAVRKMTPHVMIEVLIPDLQGDLCSIEKVVAAGPDIIGHNVDTVSRLYRLVRPEANFRRSLDVLRIADSLRKSRTFYTKSGLMVGLGETQDEVLALFQALRGVGCDFVSVGQYLAPSRKHYPVAEYVSPHVFSLYRKRAQEAGFLHAECAPYVRSSYRAAEYCPV